MSSDGFNTLFVSFPDSSEVWELRDKVEAAIASDLPELRFFAGRLAAQDGCTVAAVDSVLRVIRDLELPQVRDVPSGAVVRVMIIRNELTPASAAFYQQGKQRRRVGWRWCRHCQTPDELRVYRAAVIRAAQALIDWYEWMEPDKKVLVTTD